MKPESSIIFFPCRDLPQTLRFYTQAIGLTIHQDMGDCVILDTGEGFLGFCQYHDGRPMASGACISFNLASVDKVDQAYSALVESGQIAPLGPPQKHAVFPVYSFFFHDPNGYLVELQKILEL